MKSPFSMSRKYPVSADRVKTPTLRAIKREHSPARSDVRQALDVTKAMKYERHSERERMRANFATAKYIWRSITPRRTVLD